MKIRAQHFSLPNNILPQANTSTMVAAKGKHCKPHEEAQNYTLRYIDTYTDTYLKIHRTPELHFFGLLQETQPEKPTASDVNP